MYATPATNTAGSFHLRRSITLWRFEILIVSCIYLYGRSCVYRQTRLDRSFLDEGPLV
jgi:hypothetical protein